MNYQETLDYMFDSLPMYQRIGNAALNKDLTKTLALCEAIGNPQRKQCCIHVAGTNGKGSTSHFLAAILTASGLRVGVYTSPHYRDFRERIKIGGEYIAEQAVIDFISTYKKTIEQIEPSFFEMTVAMAFDYFAKQAVDIAIIEVGLGGRLDSTNIITPLISVITNISLDHQAMLGDSLVEIAGEKAGIIKPKIPVVISETQTAVKSVFQERAAELNAPIYFADDTYTVVDFNNDYRDRMRLSLQKNNSETVDYQTVDYQIDAFGEYQLKNVIGVLKTIDILNEIIKKEINDGVNSDRNREKNGIINNGIISNDAIKMGLANVRQLTKMQGRWQILAETPLTIADSGHNEGGLRQTMQQLAAICNRNSANNPTKQPAKLHFILGVVNDKTLDLMFELLPKNAIYYFAKADIPRGLDAETLQKQAAAFGLLGDFYNSVQAAFTTAQKNASKNDVIFVGGSCFTVAEVI